MAGKELQPASGYGEDEHSDVHDEEDEDDDDDDD